MQSYIYQNEPTDHLLSYKQKSEPLLTIKQTPIIINDIHIYNERMLTENLASWDQNVNKHHINWPTRPTNQAHSQERLSRPDGPTKNNKVTQITEPYDQNQIWPTDQPGSSSSYRDSNLFFLKTLTRQTVQPFMNRHGLRLTYQPTDWQACLVAPRTAIIHKKYPFVPQKIFPKKYFFSIKFSIIIQTKRYRDLKGPRTKPDRRDL